VQGRRVQVEKIKPSNIKNESIRVEPNFKHRCNTPSCNTQNPSSRFLCDECTHEKYSAQSTSEIPDNSIKKIQEKPPAPSRPSYPSISTIEPKLVKIAPIGPDQTKWCCELCNYNQNSSDNERCISCDHDRRPQQNKSSSTKSFERPTTLQTNVELNRQGNLLFQSVLSD